MKCRARRIGLRSAHVLCGGGYRRDREQSNLNDPSECHDVTSRATRWWLIFLVACFAGNAAQVGGRCQPMGGPRAYSGN
jgi:hypothetical protein